MTLKHALFILVLVLIPPMLGLAGATALGWLCFEWSLRGVGTAFGVYIGWITILAGIAQVIGLWPRRQIEPPCPGIPCQAPRPLMEFVGRRDEIKRLTHALKPGNRAAITGVVGMGGIGKTELAKIVAHRLADRFRNGVLWADCGDERLTDVADRWATAYGVERLPGDDLPAKAANWRGLISDKEALLVFDNVQPGQDIEPLFPAKGRSTVLVTTRHAQHPALWSVDSLRLDQFTPAEAMALAERVLGRKAAHAQRAEAEHLFELVGYLPLAVSIALHTAREKGWALAELNRELRRAGAIRVLKEPDRERSLRATFQTAWESLPGDLQRAFASLAVFNQGPSFDTLAMAAVLESEEPDARALLHRLAGRSLLTPTGDGRWRLHPLLREFATEKLPTDDPTWGRMAAHYVEVAGAADKLYLQGGEDVLHGLALFDLEWPHIQAGHEWAVRHAETDEEATRLCSAYLDAAVYCLDLRLHPRERILWLEAAVEAARRLGGRGAEGRHLGRLGRAYADLAEMRRAIGSYKEALEIAREIGDRRVEGRHLGLLGRAYGTLGKTRKAIGFYEEALKIAQGVGDQRAEGRHLGCLGNAYAALGEMRKAIGFHEEALEIAQEIGDRRGEANRLGHLGWAYAALGKTRKAIGFYEEALKIAQEIGYRRGEANHLGYLGRVYAALGETGKAIGFYEEALKIAQEIGYPQVEGRMLGSLGLAYADLGETRKAIGFYEEALKIVREIGDRRGEGNHLANMGQAYKRLGNLDKARELWEETLRIYEEIEGPRAKTVREWLAELEGGR